ncbi:MAG: glycosyltransferase family 4 protein [Eubacterium sp.]
MDLSDIKPTISIVRIVLYFYPFAGGCSNHVRELSEKINPYLKNQIIIAPDVGSISKEFDRTYPIPIIRVKSPYIKKRFGIPVAPLNNLLYIFNVYKVLKKIERPDIIHAHGIGPVAFGSIIGKFLKVPVVGMLHGSTEAYSRMSGLFESLLAILFKPDHALILDDGSPAPQKFSRLWRGCTSVVYHGIDAQFFKPCPQNSDLRQRLGFKKSDFLVLSTSSLIAVKNLDLAIEAFAKLLEGGVSDERSAYLIFAGDGELKEPLIKLAKLKSTIEHVKFIGTITPDKIKEYLSIANVVVGTSLYSNMNRSIQEAMSAEVAIVAFNSGRLDRLIDNGYDGLLAKPGDISDFTDKLKMLYENPELRRTIGTNARKTIISTRSWNSRIEHELSIYNQLIMKDDK